MSEYTAFTQRGQEMLDSGIEPDTVKEYELLLHEKVGQIATAAFIAEHPEVAQGGMVRPEVQQRMAANYQANPERYGRIAYVDPLAAMELAYQSAPPQPSAAPAATNRSGSGWNDLKPMDRHGVYDPGVSPFESFRTADALREAKARLGDDQQAARAVAGGRIINHPAFDNPTWEAY